MRILSPNARTSRRRIAEKSLAKLLKIARIGSRKSFLLRIFAP